MKKFIVTFSPILLLSILCMIGCGKEESETITVPNTVVTEHSSQNPSKEPLPEEPTAEEPTAEEPASGEEPLYPYWSELHDFNLDQPVLDADGAIKNLTIQLGNKSDELYVTWFSKSGSKGKVSFESDGSFFSSVSAAATTTPSAAVPGYYRNCALVTGLEPNTVYTYSVKNGSSSSPSYTYETPDFESNDLTFTIAGDPEIGLGDEDVHDSHRSIWRVVLNRMKSQIPESEFLLVTGDQVAKPDEPKFYDYYLDNSVLYSTPMMPLVGNHDVESGFFGEHFSLPNKSPLGTSQGDDGDYWFIKGNVLFMVINTSTVMDKDIHEQFIAETLEKNPDVRWRVVVSHYSPVTVVERYQGIREDIRYTFGYMAKNFDIDLFLGGHDHVYTRSYFLDQDCDPLPDQTLTNEFHNPEEPLYVIFGSSTDALLRDADDTYPWAAKSVQNGVPQLSKAHVTDNSFTITTYDADTWNEIDSFTIYKD